MEQLNKPRKVQVTLQQRVVRNIGIWTSFILAISLVFGVLLSLQYYRNLNNSALDAMLDHIEPYLARAAWQVNAPAVEFSLEALLGDFNIVRVSFSEPFTSITVNEPGYEEFECYRETVRKNIGQDVEGIEIEDATLTLCHKATEFSRLASFVSRLTLPFALAGLLIIFAAYWMVDRIIIQPIAKISGALKDRSGFMAFELDNPHRYDDLDLLVDEIKSLTKNLLAERDIVSAWFYNSNDGLVVVNRNDKVERFNRVAQSAFPQLTEPDVYFQHVVANGSVSDLGDPQNKRMRCNDGRVYSIRHSSLGRVEGVMRELYTIQDITIQDIIAQEKSQQDKLSTVGSIAVGIAHDLNNLLAVIQSTLEVMRRDDKTTQKHQEFLDDIEKAVDSGGSLTRQFTTFARKSDLDGQIVNTTEIINRTVSMYSYGISNSLIRTELEIEGHIFVDPNMLVNSLLNLLKNASDASLNNEQITIATRRIKNDVHTFLSIEVIDRGIGIPPHQIDSVTDPFFTTKSERKGTGLGLTSVKHFAADWGGELEIASRSSRGTVVRLIFPERNGHSEYVTTNQIRVEKAESKRILVVEDNVALLRGMVLGFQSMQHRVDGATDCETAIGLLEKNIKWDVVVCDINLPDGHGTTIFETFRKAGNDAVFVFVSGAFAREDVDAINQIGTHYRVSKPFRSDTFSALFNKIWS